MTSKRAVMTMLTSLSFAQTISPPELLAPQLEFKVTIVVVNDSGAPVPGANTHFCWGPNESGLAESSAARKTADKRGLAEFSGVTRYSSYVFSVVKEGHYPTRSVKGEFLSAANGHRGPWDQRFIVVIKPIRDPVSMYAKRIIGCVPGTGEWVAYDLQIGDWVAPIGKGNHADFEFRVIGVVSNRFNYIGTLDLRLPGDGNGILANQMDTISGSTLSMPYVAPAGGYQSWWRWKKARTTPAEARAFSGITDESYPARGFIFRVRSILNARGRVIRACYGKIPGPFIFDPIGEHSRGFVSFSYYLNPHGTRHLEFDVEKNQFTDLEAHQLVTSP
jgi:hypothetical protein